MITARLYNYFTDPEKGKRRQVAAGVLGLMALASGALITGEFLARDIGTRASSVLFKGLNLHQQLGDHHPFSEVLASSHHTLAVAPPHNIASQHQLAKTALARPLAPKPAANPNYSPLLSHHAVPKAAPQTEHLFQQPGPRHAFHEPKVPAIHLEHAHHPLNHAAGHKAIVKHEVTLQLNHRGDTIENEVRHYLQANHYSHDSSTVHRISSEILYRQHLSWHQATQLRLHYHIHIMREMLDQASKPRRLKTAA